MELSKKERIIEYINSVDYSKITVKQFAVIFGVSSENIKYLEKEILVLQKQGYIFLDDSRRICKIDFESYVICKYQLKSKKFGFGIPIIPDEYCDVNIKNVYINRETSVKDIYADDIVLVKITKKAQGMMNAEGKVVSVISHANHPIVATLQLESNFAFAVCMQKGISDVYIPNRCVPKKAHDGDVVLVNVTKYATGDKKAEGEIVKIFSKEDKLAYDRDVIFAMHNVDDHFSASVINEAKEIVKNVGDNFEIESKKREDRRGEEHHIFTIDDITAKDLDDAVEVQKINEDKHLLSVHIADVSYFVTEKSELDKEAVYRGTSIYIPNYVVAMLPKEISNGVCSLNENEDKLTLSVDMEIDKKGNVLNSRIYKSVIRSKCRMNYADVEKVLNGDKTIYPNYQKDLMVMKELAQILQLKRVNAGSINFDLPESKITLNEDGTVAKIEAYKVGIANEIIEEFMLMANYTVAKTCVDNVYPAIYRIHEKPDSEVINTLKERLSVLGIKIKWPKEVHPKILASAVEYEGLDNKKKMIVSSMVLRSLKLARYSEECVGHFGLNFKYYAHFTSPIRRYPDLFVHRVLSYYIENGGNIETNYYNQLEQKAKRYAKSSSICEKNATQIERDANDMYMARYMSNKLGEHFNGIISSITSFGIYVKLENTVEGMVSLYSLSDYYMYDEKNSRLIGEMTKKIFEIGDSVEVMVAKVDEINGQIDLVIV